MASDHCTAGPTGNPPGVCPAGWHQARLTVYDSWPFPGTEEFEHYSGGQYLGAFAYKWTSPSCNQNGEVLLNSFTYSAVSGVIRDGNGNQVSGCHFRHDAVANMRIASVFKASGSTITQNIAGRGAKLRVATVEQATKDPVGAGLDVEAVDTCGDGDCNGCCTRNANDSPSKVLIDLEKNTMKALIPDLQGFVPTQATYSGLTVNYQGSKFDVSSIQHPTTACFKVLQEAGSPPGKNQLELQDAYLCT